MPDLEGPPRPQRPLLLQWRTVKISEPLDFKRSAQSLKASPWLGMRAQGWRGTGFAKRGTGQRAWRVGEQGRVVWGPGPELTSPLGVVTAVRRGSMSSLMLDRKFWEIRRAS